MRIETLIPDIHRFISEKPDGWFNTELANGMATIIGSKMQDHFSEHRGKPGKVNLRMSRLGTQCPRALWYSCHHPELAEPLPPWAEIKFAYGHILEALVISLVKATGHDVTGEQDELELDGIIGHRDCVIDGVTVDVKSSSSFSFQKFKTRQLELVDNFGYLDQLDAYCVAGTNDQCVRDPTRGFILAIEKQLGHMCLYEHKVREDHIRERIKYFRSVVVVDVPPKCECGTEAIGAAGNRRLDTRASYSPYKWECFPNLRSFRYKGGVMFLTKVVRKPDVLEVNKLGKVIY